MNVTTHPGTTSLACPSQHPSRPVSTTPAYPVSPCLHLPDFPTLGSSCQPLSTCLSTAPLPSPALPDFPALPPPYRLSPTPLRPPTTTRYFASPHESDSPGLELANTPSQSDFPTQPGTPHPALTIRSAPLATSTARLPYAPLPCPRPSPTSPIFPPPASPPIVPSQPGPAHIDYSPPTMSPHRLPLRLPMPRPPRPVPPLSRPCLPDIPALPATTRPLVSPAQSDSPARAYPALLVPSRHPTPSLANSKAFPPLPATTTRHKAARPFSPPSDFPSHPPAAPLASSHPTRPPCAAPLAPSPPLSLRHPSATLAPPTLLDNPPQGHPPMIRKDCSRERIR